MWPITITSLLLWESVGKKIYSILSPPHLPSIHPLLIHISLHSTHQPTNPLHHHPVPFHSITPLCHPAPSTLSISPHHHTTTLSTPSSVWMPSHTLVIWKTLHSGQPLLVLIKHCAPTNHWTRCFYDVPGSLLKSSGKIYGTYVLFSAPSLLLPSSKALPRHPHPREIKRCVSDERRRIKGGRCKYFCAVREEEGREGGNLTLDEQKYSQSK